MVEGDGLFEGVGVLGIVGEGRVGARDVEGITEFGEEELVVGAFGGGRRLPSLDEIGDGVGWRQCSGHDRALAFESELSDIVAGGGWQSMERVGNVCGL